MEWVVGSISHILSVVRSRHLSASAAVCLWLWVALSIALWVRYSIETWHLALTSNKIWRVIRHRWSKVCSVRSKKSVLMSCRHRRAHTAIPFHSHVREEKRLEEIVFRRFSSDKTSVWRHQLSWLHWANSLWYWYCVIDSTRQHICQNGKWKC